MSSLTAVIKSGQPPIDQVGPPVALGSSGNPTSNKTSAVASSALNNSNLPNGSPLSGRADLAPVGRTWPQFGQLVASYLTLGLVSAPSAPIPRAPSMEIQTVVAPTVEEKAPVVERESVLSDPLPVPPTFVSRVLGSIKSFFTALYNMLFGARNT
jgi:hypothetical protein